MERREVPGAGRGMLLRTAINHWVPAGPGVSTLVRPEIRAGVRARRASLHVLPLVPGRGMPHTGGRSSGRFGLDFGGPKRVANHDASGSRSRSRKGGPCPCLLAPGRGDRPRVWYACLYGWLALLNLQLARHLALYVLRFPEAGLSRGTARSSLQDAVWLLFLELRPPSRRLGTRTTLKEEARVQSGHFDTARFM